MDSLKNELNLTGSLKELTILKIYSVLYILICVGYMIYNWEVLNYAEGWGMVGIIGLISLGILGIIIDLILIKLIRPKWLFHLIEFLIVFFFSIELWISFNK